VVADERGNVVQEIRYDSFGRVVESVGALTDAGITLPIGFAGGLYDPDLGQCGYVRFGLRDYDPFTGRFTAKDPLGYAAGDPDLYGYCLDDPVNGVDPWGLNTRGVGGGIYGELAGYHLEGGVMVSEDDDENRVLEFSLGTGRNTDKTSTTLGAQATYQRTNASSVDQLEGVSGKVGADAGFVPIQKGIKAGVGREKIVGTDYVGDNYNFKLETDRTGKPQLGPRGATGVVERTWTVKVPKIKREYEPDLW
jgi:RHS repeat-associated protein